MPRGTIYFPVEIKQREYDAQIFFALSAAKRGYKVYVGTHAAIYRMLEKVGSPHGIYLDKSMPDESRLKWLRERCQEIWILDAEVSPVHTDVVLEVELKSRVYEYGIEEIDRFLVVGDMASKAAKKVFGKHREKILKSGWPRIDIAGGIGQSIYVSEIEKIKSKYPNYLLFASSFGEIRNPDDTNGQRKATVYESTPLWGGEQNAKLIYEKFLHTVECLRVWDADPSVPTIIVRPHVGELKSIWKQSLKGLNKTFVEDEGNAAPWIFSSEGVIHQGSTIAFQAFLAGKDNLFFTSGALSEYSRIADKISSSIVTSKLPPLKANDRTPQHDNPHFEPDIIKDFVFLPEKGSVDFILEQFKTLNIKEGNDVSNLEIIKSQLGFRSLRRALGLLRDELLWKAKRLRIHPQSVSIPGGLGKKEILRIIKVFDESHHFVVKRRTINLWEFHAIKN